VTDSFDFGYGKVIFQNPNLNGKLHYPNPNDIDRSLTESATDKIRKYRVDYNNNQPNTVSFMSLHLQEFSFRNQQWRILPLSPRGFLFDD
jgi:hypothetical protein